MKRYEVTLEGVSPEIFEGESELEAVTKAQNKYPALPRKVDYKTLKSPEPLKLINVVELRD